MCKCMWNGGEEGEDRGEGVLEDTREKDDELDRNEWRRRMRNSHHLPCGTS